MLEDACLDIHSSPPTWLIVPHAKEEFLRAREGPQTGQVADPLWKSTYEQKPLLENMPE